MRPALITILPMFAAAVLVMAGGERLSRRSDEIRTPADRDRLLDFSDSFTTELDRLDHLYHSHLGRIAEFAIYRTPADAGNLAAEIAGVRLIRVFRQHGEDLTIPTGSNPGRLPEIEIEGRKRPLDANRAFILEPALLTHSMTGSGVWINGPDPALRLRCLQPSPDTLVAILIDFPEVESRVASHLSRWIESPLTPLREAGERILVEGTDGSPLATSGPDRHGPAAAIIPHRTDLGTWQIRSWDGLLTTTRHETATLAATTLLALVLAASGVLLFVQQRRALRLAAERVSFVNRVSHELGTPLTNLSLNLDLAAESLTTRPAESRRRLGLVSEEVERLARLVANVLTFSRRERDSLELKPVRCLPGEIIRQTLDSFRPALERRGIAIECQVAADQDLTLDPDALRQITGNLLSNVEKYAAAGGWLGLSVGFVSDQLVVEVRDRGPGIPPHDRERVFLPFERLDNRTNEGSSGTGLGLAIGRDLARRMGGTLEIIESGSGAAFRLALPAAPTLKLVSSDAA